MFHLLSWALPALLDGGGVGNHFVRGIEIRVVESIYY